MLSLNFFFPSSFTTTTTKFRPRTNINDDYEKTTTKDSKTLVVYSIGKTTQDILIKTLYTLKQSHRRNNFYISILFLSVFLIWMIVSIKLNIKIQQKKVVGKSLKRSYLSQKIMNKSIPLVVRKFQLLLQQKQQVVELHEYFAIIKQ